MIPSARVTSPMAFRRSGDVCPSRRWSVMSWAMSRSSTISTVASTPRRARAAAAASASCSASLRVEEGCRNPAVTTATVTGFRSICSSSIGWLMRQLDATPDPHNIFPAEEPRRGMCRWGGGASGFPGHDGADVDHPGRVTPLVVVPGHELDHVAVEEQGRGGVDDRRMRVADDVTGDQLLLGETQDTFHPPFGRLGQRFVDLFDGHFAAECGGDVGDGPVLDRHPV